jgi:hypothetical protein
MLLFTYVKLLGIYYRNFTWLAVLLQGGRAFCLDLSKRQMKVSLEVLENPAQEDVYLLYIPPLPKTVGGETLYIVSKRNN